jgi:hypothetical protein
MKKGPAGFSVGAFFFAYSPLNKRNIQRLWVWRLAKRARLCQQSVLGVAAES